MSEIKKTKLNNPEVFINRVEEKQYFLNYFNYAPTNILFVYWWINYWKTKFISNFLEDLKIKDETYSVNNIDFINFIPNFDYFKEHYLKIDINSNKHCSSIFLNKLKEENKKWKKVVLFLDHFHYVPNFFVDAEEKIKFENFLMNLLNLVIKNNLAYIICSITYDIDKFYNDTKLANTSDFYLMEHLSKKDIYYWLEDLEKIDKKIVEKIWKNLWWSVWEIWQVLVSYKNTWSYKEKLDDLLQVKYSLIAEWYNSYSDKTFSIKVSNEEKEIINYKLDNFKKVLEKIVNKWEFIRWKDGIADFELIKELVDKDIWFYDTKQLKITANSKSLEKAFKRLLKEIN